MNRFTNDQLLDSTKDTYIDDIALIQIILNERRVKLDMYNPLNTRLNRIAIDLDDLKAHHSIKSIINNVIPV